MRNEMLQNENQNSQIEENIKTNENDEISLIDLFAVLWKRKKMIIGITVFSMIAIVIISIISILLPPDKSFLPNEYTVYSTMLIKEDDGGAGIDLGGAAAMASMMGVSVPTGGSNTSSLVLYLIKSDLFLDAIVKEFDIVTKYEIEKYPIASARDEIRDLVTASFDEDSGVLRFSCTDKDVQFAYDVVNFTIEWITAKLEELGVDDNKITKVNLEKNLDIAWDKIQKLTYDLKDLTASIADGRKLRTTETTLEQSKIEIELEAQKTVYSQLKSQLEMLNIQMQTETPTFQILEYPIIPDRKSGPSRGMLCIIVSFAAAFLSVFLAFLLNAIENIKKDPVAMAKLKGEKKGK